MSDNKKLHSMSDDELKNLYKECERINNEAMEFVDQYTTRYRWTPPCATLQYDIKSILGDRAIE